MSRAIRLCFVVCAVSLHLAEIADAIYDPSASTTKPPIRREFALPWYLDGKNSHPPDDISRSSKWSSADDSGEEQSVEPTGKAWSDWRKVSGSDIEQRTEVHTDFGQQATGEFPPTQENDKSWVGEPYEDSKDPYGAAHEIFDDEANLSWKEKRGKKKNPNYKVSVPPKTPDLYEGVPVDSKKPRQEKIYIPFHTSPTSTVAKYDKNLGVQCPHPQATGQFVYPPDCKFFVNCHQGRANVQPCAPGTLFSPDTLECDFRNKVRCYGGEIADFPYTDHTEDRGRREPLVNPPDDRYGRHHVIPRNEPKCQSRQTGYFAHPSDCTKFVQCDNGGTFIKDCGPGTVFNPDISVCDWPYKVKGCEDAFKKDPSSSADPSPPNGHSNENYESKPTNSWKPVPNPQQHVKKIECPAGHSGMLPHPETCKKFLQCANGITYIMDCGPGTAFNPQNSVCDWPYNVPGCSEDRPVHNSPTTERPQAPPTWKQPNLTYGSEEYESWNGPLHGGHGSDGWNSHGTNGGPTGQHGGHGSDDWNSHGTDGRPTGQHGGHGSDDWNSHGTNGGPTGQHGGHGSDDWNSHGTNGRPTGQHGGHGSDDWNSHGTDGRPNGQCDQTGSHSHHQGHVVIHGQHNRPNSYGNQGESQTSNQWQQGYDGGSTNDHRGTNGQWRPTPSNPGRPYPSLPEGTDTNQGSYDYGQHHHHHHHYHHNHDGPGPWDHSEHQHGPGSDEGGSSQVPSTPDYNQGGWQPGHHQHGGHRYPGSNTHTHGHGIWNSGEQETITEVPDPDHPEIDIRSYPRRRDYGRTSTNFSHPGYHGSTGSGGRYHVGWQRPVGTTTPRSTGTGWNGGYPDPAWNQGPAGGDGGMRPSQPEPAGTQPGVFVPSDWRGHGSSESGNQGLKPIPTIPPRNQWNQGSNKSPQDQKLDDWLSKTNVIQHGDPRKQQDAKMDDWRSKTNIFDAQQGNNRPVVKTTNPGPSGIYVTVNGTKGHYITKEIEINQGHSNTRKYGHDVRYPPPTIQNTYNDSQGDRPPIGWQVPPAYPSKYEPIRLNSTNNRWKPTKFKTVNKTESTMPIYSKPKFDRYPNKPIYAPEQPSSSTERPSTRFVATTERTSGRGPRRDKAIELPTVSIEENDRDRDQKFELKEGKDNEMIDFAEVIEPDTDKYDIDVLDDKESWKPRVAQNKTKKPNNSVIMSINKKRDPDVEIIDIKLAPWQEDESPFPVHYVPTVRPLQPLPPLQPLQPGRPSGYVQKSTKMAPANGQVLRLRGGSSQRDGYLEVQGIHPGWGIVCDTRNGWSLNEAHIVCRQLGYTRGAESAWQGRSNWNNEEVPWIATTEVACRGNETRFQSCKFVHGDECRVQRDAVGVRCMANRLAHCRKDEIPHEGQCYHLADPDSNLNHDEALEYCANKKSQLVDITTQRENDFLSEWLMQSHPNVVSVMTSGVGFTTFNRTLWLWGDSGKAKFQFNKWWPGWMGNKKLPPETGTGPACVVMKKQFPCQDNPATSCLTDYFFWDIENCVTSMKGHSYVCERPYDYIGCVYGKGQQYDGNANVSSSGKECLPWNDPTLSHSVRVNILNPEVREKLMGHNYCRNPNSMKESRPWCYIGSYGEREYCDIPPCGENTVIEKAGVWGHCKPKHFECMPRECIPSPWVCDGEEDCTNGRDEIGCSSHLGFFEKIKDHKLEGHDVEKWLNTPPKTCALRCKEADFTCRSFSHKNEGNVCLLSDSNVGVSGDLRDDVDFDYYEMIDRSINCDGMFTCGNNKCINRSQICDGKNDCGDRSDENICTVENLDYNIRLAGSNNSYEGRVEVKILGHWGQVCDDGFGMIDADVICKELGFELGALEVRPGGYYGNLDPPDVFMVDQLKCRGNETSLRECDFDGWGVHNCAPEEAVGVVCKSAVNTCQLNEWKCDNSPTCISTTFICDEVTDCPDGSDENSAHCDTPFELRLANGSSPLEGRVEVRHHGVWGTVCDDDFSAAAAKVICKSLGYGGSAVAKKNGYFGPGDGPIWLDEVFCRGNEAQLYKCEHNQWGRHNCIHDEDAGVICSEGSVSDSELETDTTQIPEISINDLLPSQCGKRAEDFGDGEDEIFAKVVRGSVAKKGSYPWQASIRVRGHSRSSHWCGAVVISPLHVLTAAHCLEGYNKGTYFVRAGDYNSEIDEGTEIEANIEDYYIHEDFRKGLRMNNDIALVLLKGRGIPLGEHIMPICLPSANVEYSPGLNCTISGFGSIGNGRSAQSLDLRYGWVPLLDQSVCRADYVYGDGNISDGMICAGYLDEGVDSCDGDSGGPLACQQNGAFTLYGVTSWGHHCGRANKPGVYVRVAHYRDWIDRKIRESLFGR